MIYGVAVWYDHVVNAKVPHKKARNDEYEVEVENKHTYCDSFIFIYTRIIVIR